MNLRSPILGIIMLVLYCLPTFAQQKPSGTKSAILKEIASLTAKADKLSERDTVNTKLYLQQALKLAIKVKSDSSIAAIYNIYGIMYGVREMIRQSQAYFEKALFYYRKQGISNELANTLNNIAIGQGRMGQNEASLKTSKEALKIYQRLKNRQKEGLVLMNIGIDYVRNGDFKTSVTYQLEALKIREELGNKRDLSYSLNALGATYKMMKNYDKAIEIFERGLEVGRDMNDITRTGPLLFNIGEIQAEQKSYAEAQKNINAALAIFIKISDDRGQRKCYEVLSGIAQDRGQHAAAEDYLKKAIQLSSRMNSAYNDVVVLMNLAKLNMLQKHYAEAETNLLTADKFAGQHKLAEQVTVKKQLIELYQKSGQSDKAANLFDQYDALRDSLWNQNIHTQAIELQTKYETEKKQQQIILLNNANRIQGLELGSKKLALENKTLENDKNLLKIQSQGLMLQQKNLELNQKQIEEKAKAQQIKLLAAKNDVQRLEINKRNILLLGSAGLLLVILLLGYLFYNRFKLKQEARLQAEIISQQDQATRSILNAEENERKRISSELHDGLGQTFSAIKLNLSGLTDEIYFKNEQSREMFHKTLNLVDDSCKEVRLISHQMTPNILLKSGLATAVRDFINKIDTKRLKINLSTLGLQERLDQNVEAVLYRVIQETVNNVIKHAAANALDIQLTKDNEGINVMIEDNGKGFNAANLDKFEGIGLKNIRSRVAYLKGTVDFSSSIGQGTLIAIFIPLEELHD